MSNCADYQPTISVEEQADTEIISWIILTNIVQRRK